MAHSETKYEGGAQETEADKQKEWEEVADELYEVTDAIGEPLDEKVKETVIALNVLGLPTSQSHEGHIKYGYWAAPWVDVQAPGKPEFGLVGEEELAAQIKQENGITPEQEKMYLNINKDPDVIKKIAAARPELISKKGMPEDERRKWWDEKVKSILKQKLEENRVSYEEYRKTVEKFHQMGEKIAKAVSEAIKKRKLSGKETPKQLKWRKENKSLMDKAQKLLTDFYRGRQVPSLVRLDIDENEDGFFAITNKGRGETVPEDLTEDQREMLGSNLGQYQAEMEKFGRFLRDKFFSE